MTAIPQAYLDTILPLIGKARDFLEIGETLAPIALVGNFATQQTTPVLAPEWHCVDVLSPSPSTAR